MNENNKKLHFNIGVKDFRKLHNQYYGYISRCHNGNFHYITLCCNETETIETLIHELEHAVLWHIGEINSSQLYDNICN